MKYYSREITVRCPINRFGKMGYKRYLEYVKTKDITVFNKGKRILFEEDDSVRKELRRLSENYVYKREV